MRLALLSALVASAGAFAPLGGRSRSAIPITLRAEGPSNVEPGDVAEALESAECALDERVVNGTPARVKQNPAGLLADAISAAAFSALHVNDGLEIKDSSKNLRVLWSRALLNNAGKIDDPIAYQMLPEGTRDVVGALPKSGPIVDFQEFIVSRTEFIDAAVDSFIGALPKDLEEKPQIVLFGAGYDTRSMRFNEKADFFEVDLPDVVEGKGRLQRRWKEQHGGDSISLPTRIGYDLNNAADLSKQSLVNALSDAGLQEDRPTLFVWEAVLFYVEGDAVQNLFKETFRFGDNSVYCLVDSLKPAVTQPFLHVVKDSLLNKHNLDVIDHRARWGGAVHFLLAGTKDSIVTKKMQEERGELPHSYLASSVKHGIESQADDAASFNNHWYAVAYDWQIEQGDIHATRLWGEPLVIYRDTDGNLVASKDNCPHRSAPLSMGKINDEGRLECMYHGWGYGKGGKCEHIPTQVGTAGEQGVHKAACLKTYAIHEHEGLVWLWRGELLEADLSLLPQKRSEATYPCDTILDYNVDWQYIVENNLDSPHLFWLHDGSVPPVRSLNFVKEKVAQVSLDSFKDGSGIGHYGQTAGGKPKIIRFDAPNIVRHGGASSFSEEFHIVPIAPGRTRVLLRQNLPRGPILETFLRIPGSGPFLQELVRLWNYHIALEDYSVMQGQAHNVDDLGAPHLAIGALGDDLVQKFYRYKDSAVKNDGALPFFSKWRSTRRELEFQAATTEAEVATEQNFQIVDDGERVDGKTVGTYGILKSYRQETPYADFPPVNYMKYKPLLDIDRIFRKDSPGAEEARATTKSDFDFGKAALGVTGSLVLGAGVGTAVVDAIDISSVFGAIDVSMFIHK